jgi:hypothetical protein
MIQHRHGTEIFDFPTLATSKRGRQKIMLKISNDMERVWVSDKGDVIHELFVKRKWVVEREYHVSDAAVPDIFKSQGCQFCQGEAPTVQRDWRFCPHCGAAIQRRGQGRRIPKGS